MTDQSIADLRLDPVWRQAALEASQSFAYGDTITHDWLFEHLEVNRAADKMTLGEFKALSFDLLRKVDSFRDEMLEEHQMYLVNIRGHGYKIVEPPMQTAEAMSKMNREIRKALSRAMSALSNVNQSLISLEDAKSNADAKAKVGWFKTMGMKKLTKQDHKETEQ